MRCDAMCPPLEPSKLTTASLYHTALSTLSLPLPPPPSHPLIPPPSTLPHSKLIPKTRFIIDAFKNPHPTFSLSYFLSHFHSDHYNGLSPNWSHGIIYCSPVTANLLHRVLQIPKPFIYALHLSQTVVIDGVEVSLVDANHCPGAVQFLFKFPEELCNGKTVRVEKYVHTGDFRYCDGMKSEGSLLCDFVGADAVFLDTTYCNPRFVFPSQEESVDYIVGVIDRIGVENAAEEKTKKNVLFLVATYVIGKEKILLEIARRCKRKICVSPRKTMVLQALDLGESCGVFTEDETESDVHVVGWNVLGETWPYFRPNFVKMKEIMIEKGYSRVVGFVPTGWTYEVKRTKFAVRTKDECEIHLVPYSEHSSYSELREFVRFLKPKRVVPTVGADVEKMDSKVANAMRKHFAGLVDENAVKQEFLSGFLRIGAGPVDEEKDCASGSDDVSNKEEEIISNSPSHRDDVNVGSHVRTSSFHRELGSCELENAKENDVKKALLELSDCLPSWVTESLMLELLSNSDGCIVDAVSNFYERETEFYGHVFADVSMSCNIQTNSENEPALPFESSLFKSKDDDSVHVAFSQKFTTTSSSGSGKKTSGVSPLKRKRNLNKKTTSRARTDDSKQYSITKFFNKKVCVVAEDGKTEDAVSHNNENKISLAVDATPLYLDEVNQFIQIVNGSESLRSSAFTILEKAKGDINLALNMYYNDNTFVSNEMKESLRDCNEYVDSESVSTMCPMDVDAQLLQTCQPEIKSDICCPVSKKNESSGSFISLPPERYYPIDHGCWKKGEPAPYLHIARTFNLVEEEKGKLKTTSMLCNMFRSLLALSPEDILPAVYLCTNHIAPEHENMELNVGGSIVVSSLEEACGTSRSKISALYKTLGDLGDVAQLCRQTQLLLAPPASLTIQGVYAALRKISVQTGSGSTTKKKNLIVSLMRSCREMEIKFLVRTLVRNLRIGAMMRTILPALAQAIVMNSAGDTTVENLKDQTQRLSSSVIEAYNMLPNLDLLIPSLMERGSEFSSSTLSMVPGTPIKPMLAKITNGAPQVLKSFQGRSFTCEYKYDGQRAQIHRLTDGSIHVFSRNGDETTSRFPDLVDIVKGRCGPLAVTFILDAEVVGIDRKNGMKLMSFQELSSRERGSRDSLIAVEKIKVGICVFVFDIMFANGEQLLGLSLRQRRKYLKELFGEEKPGFFEYAREMSLESHDADVQNEATLNRMNSFLENALCSSCEGIMVKSLDVDARYTPSKRSDAWLKVKRDYVDGLNDSLDLVPIGAWYGNGRKAGWFSPFLMACYNPDTEEFQSVCRVMSGFADSFYAEMKDFFSSDKILPKKPPYYRTAEEPNMWFSPELVWKIRGADFTVSPVHHAAIGLVHPSRGISVRFPRFIESALDRKPEECSTSADIAEMFHLQSRKMNVNTCHE